MQNFNAIVFEAIIQSKPIIQLICPVAQIHPKESQERLSTLLAMVLLIYGNYTNT